jgi:hypothetical protein
MTLRAVAVQYNSRYRVPVHPNGRFYFYPEGPVGCVVRFGFMICHSVPCDVMRNQGQEMKNGLLWYKRRGCTVGALSVGTNANATSN